MTDLTFQLITYVSMEVGFPLKRKVGEKNWDKVSEQLLQIKDLKMGLVTMLIGDGLYD